METRYELGKLSLLPPTAAEVESARNYALGTLATSLSTQSGLASTLSMLAGLGLDETWLRDHPAHLAAVTPLGHVVAHAPEINDVARLQVCLVDITDHRIATGGAGRGGSGARSFIEKHGTDVWQQRRAGKA